MALYAFDGTWNEDDGNPGVDAGNSETNVVKFREAYDGNLHYIEGVGTRFGTIGRILGQSLTILANRTWWADAFATGVFVLGPEEGMQLIEATEGAEGVIIDRAGTLHGHTGRGVSQHDRLTRRHPGGLHSRSQSLGP